MVRRLLIFDADRNVLDIVSQNEKAFNKSLEHSALWITYENGKILPYRDQSPLKSIIKKGPWNEATLLFNRGPQKIMEKADNPLQSENSLPDIDILEKLISVLNERKINKPEGSYTSYLFDSGISKIRKKTGEEAVELILAEKNEELICEAADLIYHVMTLFCALDVPFNAVFKELKIRHS